MARLILYCVKLALLVAAVVWLAEYPGAVTLDWHGWRIETNVAVLLLLCLALTALSYALVRSWRLLISGPRGWRRRREAKARDAGFKAITEGLIAVAAGDGEGAKAAARKSFSAMGNRPLALLLTAQAAMLEDDAEAARRSFTSMLEQPETRFLGHRGLAAADLKDGDTASALEHVRAALQLKPKSRWALGSAVDLSARAGDWQGLGDAVDTATSAKSLPADDLRRYRLLAALGAAHVALEQGDWATADLAADTALRHDAGAVPAVLLKARTLLAQEKPSKALTLIEKHWARAAHHDLGQLYITALGDMAPLQAVSRAEALIRTAPANGEGHLVRAALAVRASLWGEARRHLRSAEEDPAVRRRALTALAGLEEAEHHDLGKADAWRIKALAEPAIPAWHCTACGTPTESWGPHCPSCGAVGTVTTGGGGSVAGGALLPATAL